jgi:AcrR family transcriptional regulator
MYQYVMLVCVNVQALAPVAQYPQLLPAARVVLADHGLSGLTLERLSTASGVSRMTLHRKGITRSDVVDALLADTSQRYLSAVLPALTVPGTAAERLRAVLIAMFAVADDHLPLLAGLFARPDSVFHDPAAGSDPVGTSELFTRPIARLLRDGALDHSLRVIDDPDTTAAAIFNIAGWGYVHLRHAQRWTTKKAATSVLDIVLPGLVAGPQRTTPRRRIRQARQSRA